MEYNRPYSKKAADLTITEMVELLKSMTEDEKLRALKSINEQLGITPIKKEIPL